MSTADLQTALENLDDEIVILTTSIATNPTAFTIEGLTAARTKLSELIKARKDLQDLIQSQPDVGLFEIRTNRLVP
jgi:hypothetical protein